MLRFSKIYIYLSNKKFQVDLRKFSRHIEFCVNEQLGMPAMDQDSVISVSMCGDNKNLNFYKAHMLKIVRIGKFQEKF